MRAEEHPEALIALSNCIYPRFQGASAQNGAEVSGRDALLNAEVDCGFQPAGTERLYSGCIGAPL